ncbi:MAG: hypothetical protein V4465_00665 [Patescibacteria group bacterium]
MNKLVSAILSLYIGSLLYIVLPFTKVVTESVKGTMNIFWIHAGMLLVFSIPLWFILNRVVEVNPGYGARKALKATLLTLGFVGIVLSISYHLIPIQSLYDFPPIVDRLFASSTAYAAWLIAPLIVLFF